MTETLNRDLVERFEKKTGAVFHSFYREGRKYVFEHDFEYLVEYTEEQLLKELGIVPLEGTAKLLRPTPKE